MSDYAVELEFAKSVALKGGAIARRLYRADVDVAIKADESPVTLVDTSINALIIKRVTDSFPEDIVEGEEEQKVGSNDRRWVCDPIDGTLAFIYKLPTFMVSIALVVHDEVVVAVAHNPMTNELYWAAKGGGSWRDGVRLHVSGRGWGKGSIIAGSSTPIDRPEYVDKPEIIKALRKEGVIKLNAIGAVYKGCQVAEGSIDGCILTDQHSYDVAAISLLVSEAGGRVTNAQDQQLDFKDDCTTAIMTNKHIYDGLHAVYAGHIV